MFVEPTIPKPADPEPLRRLETGPGLDALLWDVCMGDVVLKELDNLAGRVRGKEAEHLITLHTPIVIIPKHAPSMFAMAFTLWKGSTGLITVSWYDNVKEAECSFYTEDEHEEDQT